MADSAKDPMDRIADALESMAKELSMIAYRIEEHGEVITNFGQGFWQVGDNIAAAIRGEPKPELD